MPEREIEALRAEVERLRARNARLERLLKERASEADAALEHLTSILFHISDAILVTDAAGELRLVNPAVTDLFGVGPEAIGRQPEEVLTGELAGAIRRGLDRQGSPVARPIEVTLTGDRVGKAVTNVIRSDDGEVVGTVTVVRDTTFEREVERAKSAFTANVSHELRTPLTSILGFAKILERRLDPLLAAIPAPDARTARHAAQVKDHLRIVVTESERLTRLINDVLDLAKIEAGRMEWRRERCRLDDIVRHAAAVMTPQVEELGLALRLELPPGLPEVDVDRERILQVVLNLVSNALKFTRQGHVTCAVAPVGDALHLQVRDTGIGIPAEHHADVFEAYRQIGNHLTDKPVGTGLGLPFSRQVIEHHGGRITLESAPGAGSTFTVILPIAAPPSTATAG